MKYISNAFSIGMVPRDLLRLVRIRPCDKPNLEGAVSCVGHLDTANVLGVPMNRISVTLKDGDVLFVAQLKGGRLPEGATTLPDGFEFDWCVVSILKDHQ